MTFPPFVSEICPARDVNVGAGSSASARPRHPRCDAKTEEVVGSADAGAVGGERSGRRRERDVKEAAQGSVVPEEGEETEDTVEGPCCCCEVGKTKVVGVAAVEEKDVEVGGEDPEEGGEDV
jgi:hypothetical protein